MANQDTVENVEIGVNVVTKGSIKELGELRKQLNNLAADSKEFADVSKRINKLEGDIKDAKSASKGWVDSLADSGGILGTFGKGIQSVGKSFSSLNNLFKTSVIGLVVSLISGLVGAFAKTDGAMKKLQPLLIAFEKIFQGIFRAVEPLVNTFIDLAISAMPMVTKAIGVVYAGFTALLQSIGKVGSAIVKLFKGDFSGALNDTKEAFTSFDDNFNAAKERFEKGTEEMTETEKKNLEDRQKAADEAREKRIKKLDAQIENEIAKENTKSEELKKLLDQRLKEEFAKENLSEAEKEKLRREYAKRLEDALKEDEERKLKTFQDGAKKINDDFAKSQEQKLNLLETGLEEENNKLQIGLSKGELTERQFRKKTYENNKKYLEDQKALFEQNQTDELKALEDLQKTAPVKEEEYQKQIQAIKDRYAKLNLGITKTLNKAILDNTIATNKEQVDDTKKANQEILDAYSRRVDQIDTDFLSLGEVKNRVANERIALQQQFDQGLIDLNTFEQESAELNNKILESKQKGLETTLMLADAVGFLAGAFGEESEAGAALLKVQEALNLAVQIANAVNQIQTFTEKAKAQAKQMSTAATTANTAATAGNTLSTAANTTTAAGGAVVDTAAGAAKGVKSAAAVPFPGSIPAVISIIATFVGIFASIRNLLRKKKETEDEAKGDAGAAASGVGSKFAEGGLLVGPRHSQGGIKSAYGELEGGEFVVNRQSTKSFLPLLSAINEAGNRKYANGGTIPSISDLQEMMTSQPQPIIKTYVVSSEMSSAMEADKKISDLAKL